MSSVTRASRPLHRCCRDCLRIAALAGWLSLAGCTVGPDYVRPSAPDSATFRETPPADGAWKAAQPLSVDASGTFWSAFGDPILDALIAQAATANQSIVQADANYRAAQATVRLSRSALFPTIGLSASESRSRSAPSPGRPDTVADAHAVGLQAAWEPDLWGSVRRSIEAAGATAQSTDANLAAVRLLIQSEIATDYLGLRIADETSDLLATSVEAYAKALKLTQSEFRAGTVSQSDVALATAQLKSTQSQLTDVVATRAQLEHAIAVLAGRTPAAYTLAKAPLTATLPAAPVGLPSQLLERRPDIAQAERLAAAANADIGVAQAAYFPVLTLSASGGDSLASLGRYFTAPGRVWSLGASLAQTLFDGGARRAQTDRAIANYDAAVAAYRQTVLNGFEEVEDNLALLRVLESEQGTTDEAVTASRTAERIALSQYRAGTTTYLSVVTAQNAALTNERTAVTLRGRRYAASVALIRAIGGGWTASQLRDPLAESSATPSTVVADRTVPSR
jgi:NodT family efflux transporter outer membrane factor (OMF) lipoprotein